jgi:hypothetical protein
MICEYCIGNDAEAKALYLIRVLPGICLEELRKQRKNLAVIAYLLVDI